jgi:alkylation response protein AidB-like acyl-CoA dehydrogenase
MTWSVGKAGTDDSAILNAAIELTSQIVAASEAIEEARRIPPHIAQAMKDAGIFGMVMPRAWGGPELDLLTQLRVIEKLAKADGSVGWCAMIGCEGGYLTAFLDQDVARVMYPDIQVATGFAVSPTGKANRVPGGYRVEGRFPFVSGCHHCQWLCLGCVVNEDGTPRSDTNGVPETRQCFVELSQCEILDTWYTTGLRGTGSNDVLVRDVFVPEKCTFSFQDQALIRRPGPLHAFPYLFAAKGPAVALGITRHAVDALLESATTRPARRYTIGNRFEAPKKLGDDAFVQESIGRADALLAAARAYYLDVMASMWATLVDGESLSELQLARFTTLHAYVIGACVEVVQLAYKTVGGTAVYAKGPLDRCLRDILTMNQHAAGTLRTYEMAGRLILGMEPLSWLF